MCCTCSRAHARARACEHALLRVRAHHPQRPPSCSRPPAGAQALRCLALALKPLPPSSSNGGGVSPLDEAGLTFVAMVAMHDPPRRECASAIQTCRQAGVRVVVVTGDNQATAEAVCRGIGALGIDAGLDPSHITSITGVLPVLRGGVVSCVLVACTCAPAAHVLKRLVRTAAIAAAGMPITATTRRPASPAALCCCRHRSHTGAEFDALSPEQQVAASASLAVFARVEPLHKLRLVELLRAQVCAALRARTRARARARDSK